MTMHRTASVAYHRVVVSVLMTAAVLAFSGCAGTISHAGEAGAARLLMNSEPQGAASRDAGRPVTSGGWRETTLEPAPAIFEVRGRVAWDGDRTLQGIWLAHPDADGPRRVRIFNADNGRRVDGALFRRRSDGSGPEMVISSDAASALGMSAKRPAELRIVALRPVPAEVEPPAAQDAPDSQTGTAGMQDQPAQQPAGQGDGPEAEGQVAASAPDSGEAAEPEAGDAGEKQGSSGAAADAAGPARRAASGTGPPDAERGRTTFFERAPVPARASMIRPVTPVPATEPTEPGVPKDDGPASEVDHIADEPNADPPVGADPQSRTDTPAPAASEGKSRRADAGLRRPFIQAGIFAVPGNARRLVDRLKAAGVPAQGRAMRFRGRDMTRVVAGPFRTRRDLREALTLVRRIGPDDAVPVKE